MIPTIRHSGKGKDMETVKKSVVARDWEQGERKTGEIQKIYRLERIIYIIS